MESKWLAMVLVVLSLGSGLCDGCLEEERFALFQLKPFFEFIDYKFQDLINNIYEKESSSNCCEWERVECNPITRRVTHLFLNYCSNMEIDWYLNASLFLPFEKLQSIFLRGNFITGCVSNQGFERLSSKLDKLENLDLSNNHFNNSILASLSELSSLKSLNLAGNVFTRSNPTNGIEMLSKLNNLETLDLSGNRLGNNILSQLDGFASLKSLRLEYCGLEGTLDIQESNNNWMKLKELYLEGNEIESLGSLFHGKEGMKLNKLEVLSLRLNFLNNSVFSSLVELSNLKSLDLFFNKLEGAIYTKDLNALSNLEELILDYNEVNGFIPSQGLRLMNLKHLDLSNNGFNNSILASLATLPNLKTLSIGISQCNGLIDMKDLYGFGKLEELTMASYIDAYTEADADAGCSFSLQSLGFFPTLNTLSLDGFNINETTMASYSRNNFTSLKRLKLLYCNVNKNLTRQEGLNLRRLEELELSYSSLPSNFIQVFGPLISLKKLTASDIDGNNSPPMHDVCESTNLQELGINGCNLKGSLPMCFSNLTSLKMLSLSYNQFSGNISALQSLTLLESLDISSNQFSGNISAIQSLTLLASLDLSSNQFSGNILAIQSLTLLESLDLSSNKFSGTTSAIQSLTLLASLDLSFNQFSGNISAIQSLTLLASLDLSFNQLSGNISALESLTSLQLLDVSNNKFHIPSSLRPFFNLSKLKYFHADNNTIHADDHEMSHSSAPRFRLSSISLSCCGSVGSFPKFLYHQSELQHVDLSNIYFKVDRFPFWLLENNTMLVTLNLVNCSLSGPFQVTSRVHSTLSYLNISNNAFGGNIPARIGAHLPFLVYLNMSKNYFNGSIPSSFGDTSSLQILDLSNNQLSGEIPEHMAMGCSSLQFLGLSNNKLQGSIFSGNFNLTSLLELELNGNNFTGMIPNVLANCSYLYILDLSNNSIYGEVPSWIWNMSELAALDVSRNQLFGRLPQWRGSASNLKQVAMADNQLEGLIPRAICSLNLKLQFLDLSMNSLSGTLPSCFKPGSVREVHLFKNKLQGALPNAFHDSCLLVTLDLSYNHLKGNIPNWVSNLSELSYLLLRRNHFEGEIPIQLCKLDRLSLIDLSQNNLSGGIPYCLKVSALNYAIEQNIWLRSSLDDINSSMSIEVSIEYTVKSRSYNYKRRMLQYMSGIDLSSNKLTGEISFETRNIMKLFTLNLSHNSLTGPIPQVFSNLKDLESLDLSYNNLTGNIPVEFGGLHFLQYFNVSYNNLSGKTPERIRQLGTFDESCYVGNPFLCGSLVGKNCSPVATPLTPKALVGNKEDHGFIDMDAFYASFFACYVVVLLCITAVLFINPYWRQAWFYYIQMAVDSCYYFVVDNFPINFCSGNM
ncbi:receptor-like protein 15 isoform X5 [Gossypium hirsutum]|uniref:Receptor-like protein 15 isoform X5 n=1 Tax=Gossypium hirsutum TaxID=3635 RepID=A0ABM3ABA6_GOSHI|nr:receptor-like protein 15 isoform X5 [Gossypium hirsutum]